MKIDRPMQGLDLHQVVPQNLANFYGEGAYVLIVESEHARRRNSDRKPCPISS